MSISYKAVSNNSRCHIRENTPIEIRETAERLAGALQKPACELLLPFLHYFNDKPTFKWDGGVRGGGVLRRLFCVTKGCTSFFEEYPNVHSAHGEFMGEHLHKCIPIYRKPADKALGAL